MQHPEGSDWATLFRTALTHKSWSAERGGPHNERLEFLGDAVLKLLVAELLHERRPTSGEGTMSQMLHQLVENPNLARVSRKIGLGDALRLGKGEEATGGRFRESILADAFEAMLAVVYLIEGLEGAREVVLAHMYADLPRVESRRHPVSRLQEWSQAAHGVLPVYQEEGRTGPDHQPVFAMLVSVNDAVLARGTGSSKASAKASAAEEALKSIEPAPA